MILGGELFLHARQLDGIAIVKNRVEGRVGFIEVARRDAGLLDGLQNGTTGRDADLLRLAIGGEGHVDEGVSGLGELAACQEEGECEGTDGFVHIKREEFFTTEFTEITEKRKRERF